MSGPQTFTARERERFRKLLEVANSTTYDGEKDAALAAATRLARSRGMSLREAAGMSEADANRSEKSSYDERHRRQRKSSKTADFGETFRAPKNGFRSEHENTEKEKRRYEQAMADAIKRGLKIEPDEAKSSKRPPYVRRSGTGAWRSRPDFIRVLLRETHMTAREIAATVGVSVHDVYKEKLLMR